MTSTSMNKTYNTQIFYFCYVLEYVLLTSGIILIDWQKIKSKDMQTRIRPKFASRCCLPVISSLFVKFVDFFEFWRFGGVIWFSFSTEIPFVSSWFSFSTEIPFVSSLYKGWFVWDTSPWYAPWKYNFVFY